MTIDFPKLALQAAAALVATPLLNYKLSAQLGLPSAAPSLVGGATRASAAPIVSLIKSAGKTVASDAAASLPDGLITAILPPLAVQGAVLVVTHPVQLAVARFLADPAAAPSPCGAVRSAAGLADLLSGMGAALAGAAAFRVVYAGLNNIVERMDHGPFEPKVHVFVLVAAGLAAYPFDTLAVRAAVGKKGKSADCSLGALYAGVHWAALAAVASAALPRALGKLIAVERDLTDFV